MLLIDISGEPTGKNALMYSALGQKGLRKKVPTYPVTVRHENGTVLFRFAVTRRYRKEVFNGANPNDYRQGRACPPNRPGHPYLGRITESGRLGFAIMIFEPWCKQEETLRGIGTHPRKGIKIHFGPACSFGCMVVAGGKKGYDRFKKAFESLQTQYGGRFIVVVQPRMD